jgi:hypothetical protein
MITNREFTTYNGFLKVLGVVQEVETIDQDCEVIESKLIPKENAST